MLYRGSEVMREVAWVIFDEIHYMRDKGMLMLHLYLLQNVVLYGKKRSFSFQIKYTTSSCQLPFPMHCNSLNGLQKYIRKPVMLFTPISDPRHFNITCSPLEELESFYVSTTVVNSEKRIFRKLWPFWKIEKGIIQTPCLAKVKRERPGKAVQAVKVMIVFSILIRC
jgi:hypothetical protein